MENKLQKKINKHIEYINAFSTKNAGELKLFRQEYLGSKGIVKQLLDKYKALPADQKRYMGKAFNEFKDLAEAKYNTLKEHTVTVYAKITPIPSKMQVDNGLSMISIEESISATSKKVKNVVTINGALPLDIETLTKILQAGFIRTPDKIIFK